MADKNYKDANKNQSLATSNQNNDTSNDAGPQPVSLTPPPLQLKATQGGKAEQMMTHEAFEPEADPHIFATNTSEPPDDGPQDNSAGGDQGSNGPPSQLKADTHSTNNSTGGVVQKKDESTDLLGQMGQSMGADFSGVNLHPESSKATDVGALAYAQGSDIHFAPGQFKPDTQSGKELIGHELAHVKQQNEGRVKPTTEVNGMPVNDDKSLEKEADSMGAKAAQAKFETSPVSTTSQNSSSSAQPIQGFGLSDAWDWVRDRATDVGEGIGRGVDWVRDRATDVGNGIRDGAEWLGDRIGDITNTRDNEAQLDAEEDIADFRSEFAYGPQDMTSSTGIGGFKATYFPGPELLFIRVITAVQCLDGLQIDGSNTITANPVAYTNAQTVLQSAVTAGMALPPADRAAFVAQFQFTAEERTNRLQQFQQRAQETGAIWSNQHQFFVDRPFWHDVNANVLVSIDVHERAKQEGDHIDLKIVKTPDNFNVNAAVTSYGDVTSRTNDMTMDDSKLDERTGSDGALHCQIFFQNDSSDLATATGRFWGRSGTASSKLDIIINRWQDDRNLTPGDDTDHNNISNQLQLIGRASSQGSEADNTILAQARMDAVSAYMSGAGYNGMTDGRLVTDNQGETGATEDAEWRRVDLIYGTGEAQNTTAHEFGHVFGLDDEYVNSGGALGAKTGHSDLSEQIGGGISTHERNDSIMSNGGEVRGMHYATFGEALRTLTNISEWRLVS